MGSAAQGKAVRRGRSQLSAARLAVFERKHADLGHHGLQLAVVQLLLLIRLTAFRVHWRRRRGRRRRRRRGGGGGGVRRRRRRRRRRALQRVRHSTCADQLAARRRSAGWRAEWVGAGVCTSCRFVFTFVLLCSPAAGACAGRPVGSGIQEEEEAGTDETSARHVCGARAFAQARKTRLRSFGGPSARCGTRGRSARHTPRPHDKQRTRQPYLHSTWVGGGGLVCGAKWRRTSRRRPHRRRCWLAGRRACCTAAEAVVRAGARSSAPAPSAPPGAARPAAAAVQLSRRRRRRLPGPRARRRRRRPP